MRKKGWCVQAHVNLVSGETCSSLYSLQPPLWPFLSQLIFGTFLLFKIMKILLLYVAGAFLSPEILYQEYRGALTINLFSSLHFQPVTDYISISEQCRNFPGHPLCPQGFLQILYDLWRGSCHPASCDSFCCFWMASTRPGCQDTETI